MNKKAALIVGFLLAFSLTSLGWAAAGETYDATLHDGWFGITFLGMDENPDGTSSWTYEVVELKSGEKKVKDLSHWVLGLGDCAVIVDADPSPYEFGTDPRTGIYGVKWEVNDDFESGIFSFKVEGVWAVTDVEVGTKAGRYSDTGFISGPSCEQPDDGQVPDGDDEGEPPDGGEEPGGDGDEGGGETDPPPDEETDPCFYAEDRDACYEALEGGGEGLGGAEG